MTSSVEINDGWSGSCTTILRKECEWETVHCGCLDCYNKQKYFLREDSINHINKWSCRKTAAYEAELETKSTQRFLSEVDMVGFKPASREQIAEWKTWLSTPEAVEAHEKLVQETENAMRTWKDHRFDPVAMEKWFDGLWPADQQKLKEGPMWTAYNNYAKDQYDLLKIYNTIKGTKSDNEFEGAELAYTNLMKHIRDHGNIVMMNDMSKKHKQPLKAETVMAPKLGRRAARKLRNLNDN